MFGKVAVNIFALISGFYLPKGQRLYRSWKLINQTTIMTWIIMIIYICNGVALRGFSVTYKLIVQNTFPVFLGTYWFASAFILLLVLSPLIDNFLDGISMCKEKAYIIIVIVVGCMISRLPFQSDMQFGWNQYLWIMVMYSFGKILKKRESQWCKRKHLILAICVVSGILLFVSAPCINLLGLLDVRFSHYATFFIGSNSLLSVTVSISTFCSFYLWNMKASKIINTLAKCTFMVYLLHENPIVKPVLWDFVHELYFAGWNVAFLLLLVVSSVYLAGFFLDMTYKKVITAISNKKILDVRNFLNGIEEKFYG